VNASGVEGMELHGGEGERGGIHVEGTPGAPAL
jgi:hypothetical protein